MTLTETIQALYADIAAIKQFICREQPVNASLLAESPVNFAQTFGLAPEVKYVVISSSRNLYLNKIKDPLDGGYDWYQYQGFGSIVSFFPIDGKRPKSRFVAIDSAEFYYKIEDGFTAIRVNPFPFTTMSIRFYGVV